MILNLNTQCILLISDSNILEPKCASLSPKAKEMAKEERARRSLREKSKNFILPSTRIGDFWCRVNLSLSLSLALLKMQDHMIVHLIILFVTLFWQNFDYLLSDTWGNYKSVQEALHVRPVGTCFIMRLLGAMTF